MASSDRPRVGEILLRAGVIDQHQLRSALGEQRRWGRRLGSTLIKMGFVEEHALVRALASQLDMPVATLEGKRIHPDVLGLIPGPVAEKYMVIPLFIKKQGGANCLFVGMEDPGGLDVLDELSFRSGLPVRPVLVGPSELAEAIDRYYCRDSEVASESAALDDTNPIVEAEQDLAPDTLASPPTPAASVQPEPPSGTEELARFWAASDAEAGDDDATLPEGAGIDPADLVSETDNPTVSVAPAAAVPGAPAPMPAPVASPDPEPAPAAARIALDEPIPAPAPEPSPPPVAPPTPPAPAEVAPLPEPSIAQERPDTPMPGDALASPAPTQPVSAPIAAPEPPGAEVMDLRMRLVIQALTQLLIEKGLLTRDELHARMRDLQIAAGSDD